MRPRVLALAMLVVIVGLGVATAVLVSGLVRESRAAGESLLRLSEVVLSDGEPLDASAPTRRFRIERGETAASIAERLERDGFISSALAFRTRARLEGLDVRFEAGEYEISAAMRPSEIMMRLLRGRFASERLVIPEGWRVAQIADAIDERRPGARDEVLTRAATLSFDHPYFAGKPAGAGLEGYLFPDTYQLDSETSVEKLLETMVRTFAQRVTPDLVARAGQKGLTVHQLVTLASIVEREAQVPTERPTIASVFLNRLRDGMPLQADPTVQFSLRPTSARVPDGGYWKAAISETDLRVDSLYNTYRYRGLPPGPICSPGLAAIQAVVEAPPSDMIYFVARPDGSHVFARTLAEHVANAERIAREGR